MAIRKVWSEGDPVEGFFISQLNYYRDVNSVEQCSVCEEYRVYYKGNYDDPWKGHIDYCTPRKEGA